MVELKLGKGLIKTKVLLYSSIKEMPQVRREEFIKLSMREIGVGSTIESFNNHFAKLHALLLANKSSDAIKEMNNVFMNFFYCINKISIYSYCFAPYVCSIDGVKYEGVSIPDHRDVLKTLTDKGLDPNVCEEMIFDIKKKLMSNWPTTFLVDMVVKEEMKTF